jgi:hypothetical protein
MGLGDRAVSEAGRAVDDSRVAERLYDSAHGFVMCLSYGRGNIEKSRRTVPEAAGFEVNLQVGRVPHPRSAEDIAR